MLRQFAVILLCLFILGCAEKGAEKEEKVKVGILPIEDSLPIVVAYEEGIFKKHGLDVEVLQFSSALERDAALTSGNVNVVITDPLAVILLRDKGYDVKIYSICLGKTPQEGVFAILASPNSGIRSVEDLNGKEIAVSLNTIAEYALDMMLENQVNYTKISMPNILLRLQALIDGKVQAAVLPEPLASYAVSRGASLILSDAMMNESITHTVIVFSNVSSGIAEKFLKAYGEAVREINSDKEKYREKFVDIAKVPAEIAKSYPIPDYPEPQKLPKEKYELYLNWALKKGLISRPVPYEEANG